MTDNAFAVLDTHLGKGTFAKIDLNSGEIVMPLKGKIQNKPDKYTIQISKNKHIVPEFGKYLNHSCDPNGFFDIQNMVYKTLKPIKQGEELTFDYNTTEYEMSNPFVCKCGSEKCIGWVKGAKYWEIK